MNINVGSFKCPKCGNKDLFDFKNWTSIDKVENNAIKKKWIFYKEEKKSVIAGGVIVEHIENLLSFLLVMTKKDVVAIHFFILILFPGPLELYLVLSFM